MGDFPLLDRNSSLQITSFAGSVGDFCLLTSTVVSFLIVRLFKKKNNRCLCLMLARWPVALICELKVSLALAFDDDDFM